MCLQSIWYALAFSCFGKQSLGSQSACQNVLRSRVAGCWWTYSCKNMSFSSSSLQFLLLTFALIVISQKEFENQNSATRFFSSTIDLTLCQFPRESVLFREPRIRECSANWFEGQSVEERFQSFLSQFVYFDSKMIFS